MAHAHPCFSNSVRLLQVCVAGLEEKINSLGSLQATVTELEGEVTHLRGKLDMAVDDIISQEEFITNLMSVEEEADLSSVNSSNESTGH